MIAFDFGSIHGFSEICLMYDTEIYCKCPVADQEARPAGRARVGRWHIKFFIRWIIANLEVSLIWIWNDQLGGAEEIYLISDWVEISSHLEPVIYF